MGSLSNRSRGMASVVMLVIGAVLLTAGTISFTRASRSRREIGMDDWAG
jgi:hypothetical protein